MVVSTTKGVLTVQQFITTLIIFICAVVGYGMSFEKRVTTVETSVEAKEKSFIMLVNLYMAQSERNNNATVEELKEIKGEIKAMGLDIQKLKDGK